MLPLQKRLYSSAHTAAEENSAGEPVDGWLTYERLFAAATEPVLIVDSASGRIEEANPRAAELLGVARPSLIGANFLSIFEQSSREALRACLDRLQTATIARSEQVRAANVAIPFEALFSVVRSPACSYFLVRLVADAVPQPRPRRGAMAVLQALDAAPLGFVITDSGLKIDYANAKFAEMVEVRSQSALQGRSLVRWLKLTAKDLSQLHHQLLQRRAVILLASRLCSSRNRAHHVEICAVPVPDGPDQCWGFSLRPLPRLN